MTDIKRVGDTGIHTVEGNIAGNRANRLTKQRDKQKADYEAAKNKIKEQNAAGVGRIDDKFSAATDSLEQEFRRRTVGLVTADDFRKAKAETEEVKIDKDKFSQQREHEAAEKRKKDRASKRKKMASSLSFTVDDDADNDVTENGEHSGESLIEIKKAKKDPNAVTDFLPDKDRDTFQQQERHRLQKEWLAEQTRIKNEVSFDLRQLCQACYDIESRISN